MEKEMREFNVDYYLNWEEERTIKQIQKDLNAIKKLGATRISFEIIDNWGLTSLITKPIAKRLETDEEFATRVQETKKREAKIIKEELKKLQELKKKYEI